MLVLAILAVEESAHETKPDWGFTREREGQSRVGPRVCHRGLWGLLIRQTS